VEQIRTAVESRIAASNEDGLPYRSLIEEMERRAGTLRPVPTPQAPEDVTRGAQAERTRWLRRGELDARMAEQLSIAEMDLTQEERSRARELGQARIRSLFGTQSGSVLLTEAELRQAYSVASQINGIEDISLQEAMQSMRYLHAPSPFFAETVSTLSVPSEPAKRQTEEAFEFHVTATDCFVEIDEKNDFPPVLVDGLDE
jgi:hypothetical protein